MTAGWRRPSLLPLGLVAVAAIIILAGGTIRILDAGESCPDWPKCFGTWTFAVSEEEQLQWWEDNPDATEDTRGAGYTYTTLEIFSEWVHRLLVGLVAVPILINALWMHRLRDTYGARVRNTAALAGVLLVVQAGVGALTVMYDNRDWTVALHLCMATIWTSTLLHQYIAMRKVEGVSWGMFSTSATFLARHRARTDAFAASVLVLLALGAWVSSTAPGAQYNQACSIGFPDGWPACRGQLLPSVDHTGVLVQMVHRLGRWWSVFCSSSAVREFVPPPVPLGSRCPCTAQWTLPQVCGWRTFWSVRATSSSPTPMGFQRACRCFISSWE